MRWSIDNTFLTAVLLASVSLSAQVTPKPSVSTPAAGGNSFTGPTTIRYVAGRDPQDKRIDMFFGDWQSSPPRHQFGSLVLRDILTHGDNMMPPQPGAVLQAVNFLAYGRLQPRDSTVSTKLEGRQEILYIDGGSVLYLIGSTMDWQEDDFTAGFVFANPNATGSCGCGESFTV